MSNIYDYNFTVWELAAKLKTEIFKKLWENEQDFNAFIWEYEEELEKWKHEKDIYNINSRDKFLNNYNDILNYKQYQEIKNNLYNYWKITNEDINKDFENFENEDWGDEYHEDDEEKYLQHTNSDYFVNYFYWDKKKKELITIKDDYDLFAVFLNERYKKSVNKFFKVMERIVSRKLIYKTIHQNNSEKINQLDQWYKTNCRTEIRELNAFDLDTPDWIKIKRQDMVPLIFRVLWRVCYEVYKKYEDINEQKIKELSETERQELWIIKLWENQMRLGARIFNADKNYLFTKNYVFTMYNFLEVMQNPFNYFIAEYLLNKKDYEEFLEVIKYRLIYLRADKHDPNKNDYNWIKKLDFRTI